MKFGYFDDAKREYVIETPHTPLPWINYLGQNGFYSLISNTAGGYSFYKDAKLRRITRFRYNNVPLDTGGRMYYIRDEKDIWSPAYKPVMTELDDYVCRHGLGYSIFETKKNDISSKLLCFVPLNENLEINYLELKNDSDQKKILDVYSAVEWCLWDASDDAENYQRNLNTGEVEIEGSTIYHKTEYRERRNHYAFFNVNQEIAGFDSDRQSFLGQDRAWKDPIVVAENKSNNSVAHGWSPIASQHIKLELEPGESKNLIFMLAYVELPQEEKFEALNVINKEPAHALIKKFNSAEAVKTAFVELKTHWDKLLENFKIDSSETKLNRMVNIWHQYQNMVTFNMSRSASYFESGIGRGMGFRDSCQDLLGFVHMVPDRARQRLLDIAATQKEDGSAWHQYQPLTKKGNANIGGGFNDDPLWLVAATDAYIRETGDAAVLSEQVQFNNQSGSEESLFEHLRRSISYIRNNLGPHNLALIGRADWNDCLNLNTYSTNPSESFQTAKNREDDRTAESVMISEMFVLYGKQYLKLCENYKDLADFDVETEITEVEKAINEMTENILEHAWDGDWFLRAYDAQGNKVGSKDCDEGKIYIETQGFGPMAGIGLDDGKAKKALAAVDKYLNTKYGVCILYPSYTSYHIELGEITSYPPGYKENGGIFCHANPWIAIANTVVGDAEGAFNVYKNIAPAYTEDNSEIRKTEPYVYCQMIAGQESPNFGEGKNSWLTGTAAWNFIAVTQYILGIYPDYQGLRIKPCLPEGINKVKVQRRFRGTEYNIELVRADEYSLEVDGEKVAGDLVPASDKDTVKVTCLFN